MFVDEIKVGDRVYTDSTNDKSSRIGSVIKITPKRQDIVVDFGEYQTSYNSNGFHHYDVWHSEQIRKLTPEIENKIQEESNRRKLLFLLKNKVDFNKCDTQTLWEIYKLAKASIKE